MNGTPECKLNLLESEIVTTVTFDQIHLLGGPHAKDCKAASSQIQLDRPPGQRNAVCFFELFGCVGWSKTAGVEQNGIQTKKKNNLPAGVRIELATILETGPILLMASIPPSNAPAIALTTGIFWVPVSSIRFVDVGERERAIV